MKKGLFLIILSLMFLSLNSFAASGEQRYFGAGLGSADIEGTDDSSIKFFGGYRSGDLGFEAAYHDLGKQQESQFGLTASIEVTGMEFSGMGFLSASPGFDLFGKVGLLFWDADLFLTGFPSVSEDGNDLIFGVGAQYSPSQNISVRFEYQTTTLGINGVDFDTDVVSFGAAYSF